MSELIAESELILNSDGSIYHLNLLPEDISETIFTVGDPGRVASVSKYFDSIELVKEKREFIIHTGYIGKKRLTVMSTGMGTDNIDIVMNELDALVNVDLTTRTVKENLTSLNIIRLGTSGSLQTEVEVDSVIISEQAIGLDPLQHYYQDINDANVEMLEALSLHLNMSPSYALPYLVHGSKYWVDLFATDYPKVTTATACGFYAPQGRAIRIKGIQEDFADRLSSFRHAGFKLSNFEMETAAIYGLGQLMGHKCLSVNAILANRPSGTFSSNPKAIVNQMIEQVLDKVAGL